MASYSTTWAIADRGAAASLAESDEFDADGRDVLWMRNIGEMELMALAKVMQVDYEPVLLYPPDGDGECVVLLITPDFVRVLAEVADHQGLAAKWRKAEDCPSNHSLRVVADLLSRMIPFARDASTRRLNVLCVAGMS